MSVETDMLLAEGKIKQTNPGALLPLYETVHQSRPKALRGIAGSNLFAPRDVRMGRMMMRNVREARAKEDAEALGRPLSYCPTKPPKRGVRRNY